jgi:hypothetical protein
MYSPACGERNVKVGAVVSGSVESKQATKTKVTAMIRIC